MTSISFSPIPRVDIHGVPRRIPEHTVGFLGSFGMSCLLATRLIEAGVRFVALSQGGWDTHNRNWITLKDRLLPPFDEGFAALLNGLQAKGLLSTTAVFVTGEFGRTPKIDGSGRDHFPCRALYELG